MIIIKIEHHHVAENKWIGTTFHNATEEFSIGVSYVEKLLGKEGFILSSVGRFIHKSRVFYP